MDSTTCALRIALLCCLASPLLGQQGGASVAVSGRVLTPVLVTASHPGSIPGVDSLPPNAMSATGFSLFARSGSRPRGFAEFSESVNWVPTAAGVQLSMRSQGEVSTAAGGSQGMGSVFSTPHEYVLTLSPQLPIDAVLQISWTGTRGVTVPAGFNADVDVGNDGSFEFVAEQTPGNFLEVPLPAFSTSPIQLRLRSSLQLSGPQAAFESNLTMRLLPPDPLTRRVSASGCIGGFFVSVFRRLDGGVNIELTDSEVFSAGRGLILGSLLPQQLPLPLAAIASCTLNVAPDIFVPMPQVGTVTVLELPVAISPNLRPLDVSVQAIGITQGQFLRSTRPITMSFR